MPRRSSCAAVKTVSTFSVAGAIVNINNCQSFARSEHGDRWNEFASSTLLPANSERYRSQIYAPYHTCPLRSLMPASITSVAHALWASCHAGASDRSSGSTPRERQIARILRSAPAGQGWLANRQECCPSECRRQWWIDILRISASETGTSHVISDMNCSNNSRKILNSTSVTTEINSFGWVRLTRLMVSPMGFLNT